MRQTKRGHMSAIKARREGFALAGAVLAMVLVGAIVTGGFYAANQETAVTRSAEVGDMAQYIAEVGLENTLGRTTFAQLDGMAINDSIVPFNGVNVTFGGRTVGNYRTKVVRLTAQLF